MRHGLTVRDSDLPTPDRSGEAKVMNFRDAVARLPQHDAPLRHFFVRGRRASQIYAREITMVKGLAAVGYVHKYSTINVITKGKLLVATQDGSKLIEAPCTWISPPGVKRALYVIEDTVWTTFHLTDESDISKIKADLGTVTFEEYLSYRNALEAEGFMSKALDRVKRFLRLGTIADVIGFAAPVVGLASGVNSLLGGRGSGSTGQGGTTSYVPTHSGAMDDLLNQWLSSAFGTAGGESSMLLPFLNSAFSGAANGAFPGMASGVGANMLGAEGKLGGYADQIWNLGADPMGALHDKLQAGVVDNSRAATSARGIGMGPEAAGIENNATTDFNLNWQQGLLGRATQAGQSAMGLYDAAGREGAGGLSAYQTGLQYPFWLTGQYASGMNSGVYGPGNALTGNILQYLGLGPNAAQGNFGNQQTGMNNFTSALGQIFRSGAPPPGSSSGWDPAFTQGDPSLYNGPA